MRPVRRMPYERTCRPHEARRHWGHQAAHGNEAAGALGHAVHEDLMFGRIVGRERRCVERLEARPVGREPKANLRGPARPDDEGALVDREDRDALHSVDCSDADFLPGEAVQRVGWVRRVGRRGRRRLRRRAGGTRAGRAGGLAARGDLPSRKANDQCDRERDNQQASHAEAGQRGSSSYSLRPQGRAIFGHGQPPGQAPERIRSRRPRGALEKRPHSAVELVVLHRAASSRSSSGRIRRQAARRRHFTVPLGMPRIRAISATDRSFQ